MHSLCRWAVLLIAVFTAVACSAQTPQAFPERPIELVSVTFSVSDNQSRTTSKEAMEMAQRAGVTVYVIGADEEERGTYSGKKLAEATGGRALFPGTGKRSLDKALHAVAEELGAQYYVEFRPVDLQHDGQFHSIQVRPEDKKLKVRARKGYFAPKN